MNQKLRKKIYLILISIGLLPAIAIATLVYQKTLDISYGVGGLTWASIFCVSASYHLGRYIEARRK